MASFQLSDTDVAAVHADNTTIFEMLEKYCTASVIYRHENGKTAQDYKNELQVLKELVDDPKLVNEREDIQGEIEWLSALDINEDGVLTEDSVWGIINLGAREFDAYPPYNSALLMLMIWNKPDQMRDYMRMRSANEKFTFVGFGNEAPIASSSNAV